MYECEVEGQMPKPKRCTRLDRQRVRQAESESKNEHETENQRESENEHENRSWGLDSQRQT